MLELEAGEVSDFVRLNGENQGAFIYVVSKVIPEVDKADPQYAALATRIDQQVKSIVANCRLPAEADANLHLIVADLLQGISLMRGEDPARSRHDGAALIHGALNAYGKFFDDPAWKPDAPMRDQ